MNETSDKFPIADLAFDVITNTDKAAAVDRLYAYFEEHGVAGVAAMVSADNDLRHPYNWRVLDSLYIRSRKALMENITWAYGPSKILFTFNIYRNGLRQYPIVGKTFVDFGCGALHPYNISTLFYLNGARRCYAIDMASIEDTTSAARSLHELLIDCLSEPTKWLLSGSDKRSFVQRILQFDMEALSKGDLEAGVGQAPIEHHVDRIENILTKPKSIDVMVSATVVEHIHDLEDVARHWHRIMSNDSVSYHNVDYTDHRIHVDPTKNYWSFMVEGDDIPDDGDINKLRNSEVTKIFRDVGFNVDLDPLLVQPPPPEVLNNLAPRYRGLSKHDLEMVSAGFRMTKNGKPVNSVKNIFRRRR